MLRELFRTEARLLLLLSPLLQKISVFDQVICQSRRICPYLGVRFWSFLGLFCREDQEHKKSNVRCLLRNFLVFGPLLPKKSVANQKYCQLAYNFIGATNNLPSGPKFSKTFLTQKFHPMSQLFSRVLRPKTTF